MARAFLLLHGLEGSGPGHWQTWLVGRLEAAGEGVTFPELPDPYAPQLPAWRDALDEALAALDEPPTVLCHSLGCLLWLHHTVTASARPAARVMLVAPPSEGAGVEAIAGFFPVPLDRAAVAAAAAETRLVCAEDDPYCPEGAARLYGEPLGLPTQVVPGGGHLNADAGLGPWPALEAWCLADQPSASTSSRIAPG